MSMLNNLLSGLPEVINRIFDILDLVVLRFTLLALAGLGA